MAQQQTVPLSGPLLRHHGSALFLAALILALFFDGVYVSLLSLTLTLLVLWLLSAAVRSYPGGIGVARDVLPAAVALFWLWLALSVAWSRVPWISHGYFWWLGTLPLVFWAYLIEPDRDRLWGAVARALLPLGVALALLSVYQFHVLGADPNSVFVTRNTHAAFLNLVALPAAGYFLLPVPGEKRAASARRIVLAGALFALFYSVALTTSRGAALSLVLAVLLLCGIAAGHSPRRLMPTLLSLLAVAFAGARLSIAASAEETRPLFDLSNRLLLWEPSWNLLRDAPWHGIGLGNYFLVWPRYKDPADTSPGYFAHNDYLQIWIEAGLPALILLLAVMLAALRLTVRALRVPGRDGYGRIEVAGLFCGLLAIAVQSFVDFNLYILAITLGAGLMLGRLHHLAAGRLALPLAAFRPAKFTRKTIYLSFALILAGAPLLYFARLGISDYLLHRADRLENGGRLEEADRALAAATRIFPSNDMTLTRRAELFMKILAASPEADARHRQEVYEDTIRLLDAAERSNPLRWQTAAVRGKLIQLNPGLAGPEWRRLAGASYQRALWLNPKLYKTRMDYASLLLGQGGRAEALDVLRAGIGYTYMDHPELILYYSFTLRLLQESGDRQQAARVEQELPALIGRMVNSRATSYNYGF